MKNTTLKGSTAETKAAEFLAQNGYRVIDMNWKRPDCEIDIVAQNRNTKRYHFFEVKYRTDLSAGGGLEAIDENKLKNMVYASRRYIQENNLSDDYELGAISIIGHDYQLEEIIEALT